MTDEELQQGIAKLVGPLGFSVEVPKTRPSVGVKGDERVVEPAIIIKGPNIGREALQALSNKISNEFPTHRVLLEISPTG